MQNVDYQLPDVNLLSVPPSEEAESMEEINRKRNLLQGILEDYGIGGRISGYTTGPCITRFEITLASGTNGKKTGQIVEHIESRIGASGVRAFVPIPGSAAVGVEIINTRRNHVFMRSMVESEEWRTCTSEIPTVVGKDVFGTPVILDLAKAPHVLISGMTGTGKSVLMHTIIAGMLFKYRPEELKFILIDLKVIEFEIYEKIPHLLAPIIHDETKAGGALRWTVDEIERRFGLMRAAGVRNIREYNDFCNEEAKLPYIVIVVDDVADLMTTDARDDIENSIARIAQRGRAAGIHIIVATQRPSTHIITDTIKANLPTRFCFQVRSGVDSRVVLDTVGAEKLLGMGDMLMKTPASDSLERVQGAFIPDDDLRRIAEFVSRQAKPEFSPELLKEMEESFPEDGRKTVVAAAPIVMEEYFPEDGRETPREANFLVTASKFIREDDDDAMRRAVGVILLERKASVSYFQRRLKIRYKRAVEILDELEKRKLVSPVREDGKREILANFSQE